MSSFFVTIISRIWKCYVHSWCSNLVNYNHPFPSLNLVHLHLSDPKRERQQQRHENTHTHTHTQIKIKIHKRTGWHPSKQPKCQIYYTWRSGTFCLWPEDSSTGNKKTKKKKPNPSHAVVNYTYIHTYIKGSWSFHIGSLHQTFLSFKQVTPRASHAKLAFFITPHLKRSSLELVMFGTHKIELT